MQLQVRFGSPNHQPNLLSRLTRFNILQNGEMREAFRRPSFEVCQDLMGLVGVTSGPRSIFERRLTADSIGRADVILQRGVNPPQYDFVISV